MGKNNRMSHINILIFVSLIFIISILNIFSPKDKAISEVENRTLAQRPAFTWDKLLKGEYFREYEDFFADHFYDRENLVETSRYITALKGIRREEEVFLVQFAGQNVAGNVDVEEDEEFSKVDENEEIDGENIAETEVLAEANEPSNAEPSNNETAAAQVSKNKPADEDTATTTGNLLILNDTIMEIYKFDANKAKYYANMVNAIREKLDGSVKVYSLLAPVQIEFLANDKYKGLSDSQHEAIEFVKSNFNENIIPVNAYSAIAEHKDEYLYFRTDHHWTALGAYYAYTAFAKAAELEVVSLQSFQKGEAPGFLGYLSSVYSTERIKNNPDTLVYYIPPVETDMRVYYYDKESGEKKWYKGSVINKSYADSTRKYYIFLGGDFPLGVIKTNVNTDRKIMVIKDSYANAFVPFLTPHYSEIYVVDPRHYKENLIDLVKENNIGEVLVLNYVLTTNFSGFIDSILKLI